MIIIDLGCEICDMRCAFCNLEGYDRFVIASCRTWAWTPYTRLPKYAYHHSLGFPCRAFTITSFDNTKDVSWLRGSQILKCKMQERKSS
jgi:hypothetical protein